MKRTIEEGYVDTVRDIREQVEEVYVHTNLGEKEMDIDERVEVFQNQWKNDPRFEKFNNSLHRYAEKMKTKLDGELVE